MLFTRIIVTYVSILTFDISSCPYRQPSQTYKTLLYRSKYGKPYFEPAASVHSFSPVTSSAQTDSTSELLRFL